MTKNDQPHLATIVSVIITFVLYMVPFGGYIIYPLMLLSTLALKLGHHFHRWHYLAVTLVFCAVHWWLWMGQVEWGCWPHWTNTHLWGRSDWTCDRQHVDVHLHGKRLFALLGISLLLIAMYVRNAWFGVRLHLCNAVSYLSENKP